MGSMSEYSENSAKRSLGADETTDMALFVRTSDEDMAFWNRQRIVDALVREAYLDPATAEQISISLWPYRTYCIPRCFTK